MSDHNGQDGYYFDDYDPDESERDDGHHEERVGLGQGVYLVCHTLPDGHLLVGSVRQPNGGYRMTLPRLLRCVSLRGGEVLAVASAEQEHEGGEVAPEDFDVVGGLPMKRLREALSRP